MIEKMKKITFLVTNKEYESFIQCIGELGVVHIDQLQKGASSPQLQQALTLESRYAIALLALEKASASYAAQIASSNEPNTCIERTPEQTLERVEYLREQEQHLEQQIKEVEQTIKVLLPWGEFQRMQLDALSDRIGYQIHFFSCPEKNFQEQWYEQYFAVVVAKQDKMFYFLTFSHEQPQIAAQHVDLPEQSKSEYEHQLSDLRDHLFKTRHEQVLINRCQRDLLQQGHHEAKEEIQLSRVRLSDELVAGDQLRLFQGWVQDNRKEALLNYLEEQHIYYQMSDPGYEEDVPVQLTADRFTRLFQPILKMYSLPKYNEIDPTLFFAPFFMLFFGLCMGDAGYGLLILLGSIYVVLRGAAQLRDYARLGIFLGISTMICGLAMGTVFGIDLSQSSCAFLAPIKPYLLNDSGVGPIFGYSPMMVISVILGLIQVLLGMGLKAAKAWKNYGVAYAIGTISWLVALISAVLCYGLPLCGVDLPDFLEWMLMGLMGISTLGIFLYNSPQAYKHPLLGPLINIGSGAYNTYGMATGLLGDLLSYIRLFALGLTGGVLGSVSNMLAVDMTDGLPWVVRWLPMFLILIIGHCITFALSVLSGFVHPMRLTFVEFFKNADFEGGGRPYAPFSTHTFMQQEKQE